MLWSWLCDCMSHLLFPSLSHSCVLFHTGMVVCDLCICLWLHLILGSLSLPICVHAFFFVVAAVHLCMRACWSCSYVRPTRHYTVFLCEDSSGDELSQDDDSIAAFPEHFMLSAPFEWSLFKWFSFLITLSINLKVNIWWPFYLLCPPKVFGHTKKCLDVIALD